MSTIDVTGPTGRVGFLSACLVTATTATPVARIATVSGNTFTYAIPAWCWWAAAVQRGLRRLPRLLGRRWAKGKAKRNRR